MTALMAIFNQVRIPREYDGGVVLVHPFVADVMRLDAAESLDDQAVECIIAHNSALIIQQQFWLRYQMRKVGCR